MGKRQIFFSFHFDNDVMRVQQIRNIGAIEGNAPVSPQKWEEVQGKGRQAVRKWIDNNMEYKSCVIVLVGKATASRPLVDYEIRKAWNDKRALFGIHIHNIKCPISGICTRGINPFDGIKLKNGKKLSAYVKCHNPSSSNAYNDIAANIEDWIEDAIENKRG